MKLPGDVIKRQKGTGQQEKPEKFTEIDGLYCETVQEKGGKRQARKIKREGKKIESLNGNYDIFE